MQIEHLSEEECKTAAALSELLEPGRSADENRSKMGDVSAKQNGLAKVILCSKGILGKKERNVEKRLDCQKEN